MGLNDINSLSHTRWNCKYHIVFALKHRRKVLENIAIFFLTYCIVKVYTYKELG